MLRKVAFLAACAAVPLLAQAPVRLPPPAAAADTARADSVPVPAATEAAGDTLAYSAARLRFRADRFTLAGGALLQYRGSTLTADSIIYYADEELIEAFGAPLIEDPLNPPILGYRMRYNLRNRVGTVYYGSSEKDGQLFSGSEVRRQPDGSIYVSRAHLTTCDDPAHPHYYFYARRLVVRPESQALSGPIVMNIADVPVAVLPMMLMPLGKGRRSGLMQPRFGGDQSQGFYVQNLGYYWAISDFQDLLLTADVVEGARGTFDQTNLNGTYQWNRRYLWNGMVGGRLYVPEFQPSRAGGYMDFRNDLNITPDGRQTLKGSGRLQSDPLVVERNALTEHERLQQTANANLGYRRQFDRFNAVLNTDLVQDYNLTQNHVDRSLPNAAFSASGPLVPLSADAALPGGREPWHRNWSWNYGGRFNVNQVRRPATALRRGDSAVYAGYADQASLTGKYTAFEYLNLTPSLNASQLWSGGERTGDSLNPHRNAFDPLSGSLGQYFLGWNAAVRAETHLYGIAQAGESPWLGRLAAARHTITPAVSLIYAPQIDSNPAFFPHPKLGGTAYQPEQRSLAFQLANDVDLKLARPDEASTPGHRARPESYKALSAVSSIHHNFAAPARPWSDLASQVTVYPTRNVGLTITTTHIVYDDLADSARRNEPTFPILQRWGMGWRRGLEVGGGFNTGVRLLDTRGAPTAHFEETPWSAFLNYGVDFQANRVGTVGGGNPVARFFPGTAGGSEIYENSIRHQATGGLRLNPTKSWKMTYDTEFNFTEGQFSRHAFGFERILHCWQMNFNWTPRGVAQGWYFVIRIIDLPDIKLETRDTRR